MSVTDVNNFINNHCEKVLKNSGHYLYNKCVTLNNKIEKKRNAIDVFVLLTANLKNHLLIKVELL